MDESGRELAHQGNGSITGIGIPPAGITAQRVQTQYTTSMMVQRPRELVRVEALAMQEAALLGADAFYGWGAGKDSVEGPAVGLAMGLARCWGNCAVDMGEVQETPDAWIFTAKFVDLETGYTLTRQFRQAKDWPVYGKFNEERKDDIRFQIGQSKAVRNVILNAVPKWLVNRALDKAKGGVREKVEELIAQKGLDVVQASYMQALAKLGADERRVLMAMGRATVAALSVEAMVILSGGVAAIMYGAETVEGVFPVRESDLADEAAKPKGGASGLAARLKAKTTQEPPQTTQEHTEEADF